MDFAKFWVRMAAIAVFKPVMIWQKYNTTTLPNQAKMGSFLPLSFCLK
jgi:hypothetical protein